MQQALGTRHCVVALPHVHGEEVNITAFTVTSQGVPDPSLVSCVRHRVSENTLWSSVLLLVLPLPGKSGLQGLNLKFYSRRHSQALHSAVKVSCASLLPCGYVDRVCLSVCPGDCWKEVLVGGDWMFSSPRPLTWHNFTLKLLDLFT